MSIANNLINLFRHLNFFRYGSHCLLISLAACQAKDSTPSAELSAALAASYDYTLSDMQTYRYSTQGHLLYRIDATRFTHFPSDNHSELLAPNLLWLNAGTSPWRVQADTGLIEEAASQDSTLWLNDHVRIAGSSGENQPLTITTDKLQILLNTKQALTDSAVTVITNNSHLQSEGMHFDLPNNHLKLLAKSRATYAP
jgi:LPS export ABC transporter protein LptC